MLLHTVNIDIRDGRSQMFMFSDVVEVLFFNLSSVNVFVSFERNHIGMVSVTNIRLVSTGIAASSPSLKASDTAVIL